MAGPLGDLFWRWSALLSCGSQARAAPKQSFSEVEIDPDGHVIGGFVETAHMFVDLAVAQQNGVTIAIENHGNNLFETADSLKWLVELCDDPHLAVALAPYHLPQDENELAKLIRSLGNRIEVFYAWEHGKGCMKKLPKEQELMQMPGRGELDFEPILQALQAIDYQGWTEIFMQPVPRGIPILETTAQVTDEINRSREYLSSCLDAS